MMEETGKPARLRTTVADLHFAAVGIMRPRPDENQHHVGVLHRGEAGVEMLHLAWHMHLRNEDPPQPIIVALPDLRDSRARSVAAMCRLVWRRHSQGGLPYGVRYQSGVFDLGSADLLLDPDAVGLTCATFVLAVYASVGIQLIDCSSWPPRADDQEWHARIIALLKKYGASEEHLHAVQSEFGCSRFRPEEVAGACLLDELPGRFQQVLPMSEAVLREIQRVFGGVA